MLILIVSPSLKPRSSEGPLGSSLICFSFFNHLKWSCNATLRSNESDLSPKPNPMKAARPINTIVTNQETITFLVKYEKLSVIKHEFTYIKTGTTVKYIHYFITKKNSKLGWQCPVLLYCYNNDSFTQVMPCLLLNL